MLLSISPPWIFGIRKERACPQIKPDSKMESGMFENEKKKTSETPNTGENRQFSFHINQN